MAQTKLKIEYTFKNPQLFRRAMSHPSLVKNANGEHNEKLEFLGDKILGVVVAELLYKAYPEVNEGQLSIMHAKLVGTRQLAEIAAQIGLGEQLLMDVGEERTGGRFNKRNLENAMEALIAAIYLDSDFAQIVQIINTLWQPYLNKDKLTEKDIKSRLQEWAQQHKFPLPYYQLVSQTGKSHAPEFIVRAVIENIAEEEGIGASRKEAENEAATKLLNLLKATPLY